MRTISHSDYTPPPPPAHTYAHLLTRPNLRLFSFISNLSRPLALSLRKLFCILTARLISHPSLPRLNEKAIRMHVNAVPMAAPARFSTSTPHCFTFSTASFCLSVRSPLLSPLPLSSVAAASHSFPLSLSLSLSSLQPLSPFPSLLPLLELQAAGGFRRITLTMPDQYGYWSAGKMFIKSSRATRATGWRGGARARGGPWGRCHSASVEEAACPWLVASLPALPGN